VCFEGRAEIQQLNQSFTYAEAAIQAMSNADFAKPEKKLGPTPMMATSSIA
jgi:hypothetical protein